jgi:hypothetical protein
MESIWHLWTPGAGTVCYITRGGSTLSGTGDRYPHLASNNGTPGTTQADGQSIALASATLQNLFSNAAANTRDDACDIRVQVNGANGNGVNSWAAGATGEREDTTGTDAVVSGDEVGYIWDQNGGTGTLTHRSSKIELSGTNTYQWMACNQGGTTQANALTRYIGVGGEISATIDDIEADRQVKVPDTSTWSKLAAYVSSLSLGGGGTLTIRARKNAGDGNQTVAFSGTGQQFDTTNTDALTAGDDVCWSMVTTGSSGSTIYRTVSSLVSGGTVAPPVRMLNQGHRPAMFKPGVRR